MAAWLGLPLAWLAGVAWQLSEPALHAAWVYILGLLGAVALVGACVALRRWRAPRGAGQVGIWLLAAALLAWGSTGWRATQRAQAAWPAGWGDALLLVQVTGLPQVMEGGRLRFDAWVREAPPAPADAVLPERIRLYADAGAGMTTATSGQLWRMRVALREPDGLSNPGGFDATRGLFEQDIRATGRVRHREFMPVLVRESTSFWQGGIDRFRQRVRAQIQQRIADERAAGVLVGLSVGDQSAIGRSDWDIFRRTGVAHAVSISGTHIAMLGWLAAAVLRRFWPYWRAGVHRLAAPTAARGLAVLVSCLYAVVAGWGVPAQRTVLMMGTMALLQSGGRRWPWPVVWALSAAVITVLDPWALCQPGFWLSFVAVGILMSSDRETEMALSIPMDKQAQAGQGAPTRVQRWRQALFQAIKSGGRTQWLVSLALPPLALVCFQEVSVVGFLANLLAIPVFTLGITPLALAGSVSAPLWDLGAWLTQGTTHILQQLAAWPWAVWQAPSLPAWTQVGLVLAGLLLALPVPWRWRLLAVPCVLPLFVLPNAWHLVPAPRSGHFAALAVDIGQGTAVLLRTARHSLLFDTGARLPSGEDMGERVLVPLLRSLGVSQLDTLMISHQDSDHVGGALSVLRAVPVQALRSSLDEAHEVRQWQRPRRGPVPHEACVAGQRWEWDGVAFEVLHPTAADYERRGRLVPNALSCVLRVSTGGPQPASILVTGDIEADQEAALLVRQAHEATLRSTVLIAPHHGSKTSSTRAFLQAVRPELTVVQAGRRNRYGHPAPSVLARYQDLGLPVVASPACGAYLWASDELPGRRALGDAPVPGLSRGQCWRDVVRRYWDRADRSAMPRP